MYSEDQYIYEQFQKNFIENSSGKLVIYGVGIHTQRLLERLPAGLVSGLMDAKKTGQTLWGYKVLSYEEVAALGDVKIVVIARNAVIRVIYRRVEEFCRKNRIGIFDVNGNDLAASVWHQGPKPCFSLEKAELLQAIAEHDVITFDIFDTILMRRIYKPRDVFSFIDETFVDLDFSYSKKRMEAEDGFVPGTNPTIYEIYDELQRITGISDEIKEQLFKAEVEMEKRFLCRREKMCDIFSYALSKGKRVYLISDMYFTKPILEEILSRFGIEGYIELYISAEEKIAKQEGLFDYFLKQTGEKPERCLHIGDNMYSDVLAPQKAGICAYRIYSVSDMLEESIYADALTDCNSPEESVILAKYAMEAFANPFSGFDVTGKIYVAEPQKVASLFIAPVVTKYMLWLAEKVKSEEKKMVVFPSRDGFLLKRLYDKQVKVDKKLPPAVYLYTSRRAVLASAVRKMEDISYVTNLPHEKGVEGILRDRFGLEDIGEKIPESLDEAVKIYRDDIFKACEKERKEYLKYINQVGIENAGEIAFVDFVAMGTVQEAMQRLLRVEFSGYYFLRRIVDKPQFKQLKAESLYMPKGDFEIDANIYRFYYFLENVMASYEPTFVKIDEDGEKVFCPETRSEEVIRVVKEMHEGIYEYGIDVFALLKDMETKATIKMYDRLLGFFSQDYSDVDMSRYIDFKNVDEFMGKTVKELNR